MNWPWKKKEQISLQQLRKLFNWEPVKEDELLSAQNDMVDATGLETEAISRFRKRKGQP